MTSKIVFLLFGSTLMSGQNILYNETRDKTAKSAVEAAKQVKSGSLSTTEMRNLGVIEQSQVKSAIEWYGVTMRGNIQSFRQWSDVKDAVDAIRQELERREEDLKTAPRTEAAAKDIQDRLKAVESRDKQLREKADIARRAANRALASAASAPKGSRTKKTAGPQDTVAKTDQAEAPAPSVGLKALGDRVGQFDELLGVAKQLTASLGKAPQDATKLDEFAARLDSVQGAVADIQKGIEEVAELAQAVGKIIESWKGIRVDPASLAPSPEKIAMALLQREAEYIKALTALRVRRHLEVEEMRRLLRRFDVEFGRCRFSKAELSTQVTEDLARFVGVEKTREALEQRLLTLLLAAQISARQTGGQTMNDLRESIEYRRYQVSMNTVYNGSYETALQAAAERLAAYYASGLKPTQVAEFVYQLGTAVALPYIAVTK